MVHKKTKVDMIIHQLIFLHLHPRIHHNNYNHIIHQLIFLHHSNHHHIIHQLIFLNYYYYIVRILPYFQEEMMVQEDPIELKKMMAWGRRREADQEKLVDL